jgi:hypothetical protein
MDEMARVLTFTFCLLPSALCLPLAGCARTAQPASPVAAAAEDASGHRARLLTAFFGLDNALPIAAARLCVGAPGKDGMPVVLSHTIDPDTLQREDFRVITRSGVESTPTCVTLAPALDPGELRTVLLVGEFGGAADPPATVRVVGDILSDGATGGPVNFRGTEVSVIPLEAGPTLVLAEVVPREEWTGGRGSSCPNGTQQVVRVTWTGGVRLPNGDEVGDAERTRYRVTIERRDGSRDVIVPMALADLNDNDNNHRLCLNVTDTPLSVSFPAGHMVDPNRDLNPDTQVAVSSEDRSRARPLVAKR